jgi:DNA excision repair protein ERCC-4
LVDSREYSLAVDVVKWLKRFGCTVVPKSLQVGDYVVAGNVGVERKRDMDFLNSIIDGRLFDQASQLRDSYDEVTIIVEGDVWDAVNSRGIHRHSVIGAMAALAKMRISVLSTPDPEGTAYLLYSLGRHGSPTGVRSSVRKGRSIREAQLIFLSSLPGIGIRRAERLLEVFGSPMNALNNLNQWPRRVDGISEKVVSTVRRVLNHGAQGSSGGDGP